LKFEEAAERHRDDYRYAVVQDRKIQAHLTNVQGDCVLLFQPSRFQSKYEEKTGVLRLSSSTAAADIAAFVDTSIVPLVGQLSAATEKTVYAHRPLVVAYFNVNFHPDYWKATQQMRSILLDVANENRDVRFAIASDSERETDVGMYDLQETISEYDVGVVLLGPGDAKYPLRNTKLSVKTLRAHLAAFKEGKLEQYLKSQKPPKKNDGDVKVVVGRTFNKYVLDKTKHVMIEFYAPWCGHCKALEPKYEEAAKILKKKFANVTLAKLDATANDIPYPFEAKAYPTLYWVPSGNASKAEVYQGGREADDLVKFVEAITITTTGSDSAGNAEL
jgi:protein disulfide isomerase